MSALGSAQFKAKHLFKQAESSKQVLKIPLFNRQKKMGDVKIMITEVPHLTIHEELRQKIADGLMHEVEKELVNNHQSDQIISNFKEGMGTLRGNHHGSSAKVLTPLFFMLERKSLEGRVGGGGGYNGKGKKAKANHDDDHL